MLENLKINYTLTEKGDFRIVFRLTDEERTQIVVISSSTYQYNGLEFREVRSPVLSCEFKDCEWLTPKRLFTLLEENWTFKLGFWAIQGGSSPYLLVFCLQLDANAEENFFFEVIKSAARKADSLEKKITSKDSF